MTASLPVLIGSSPAMRRMLEVAGMMAESSYPILITGEPGTGKTVLANYIHQISARAGELVRVRIPELNDELAASRLFGHARGSFTGAHADSKGLMEGAHGGTLLLDELAEASPRVQEILRGILDGDGIMRVGESRTRAVDVRILLATNADLEEMTLRGNFRRDLLDRIGQMKIEVIPLRERWTDIPELAEHAVKHAFRRKDAPVPTISMKVMECLLKAPWPGNIRQLESVCQYAVMFCAGRKSIELQHLSDGFIKTLNSSGRRLNREEQAARMRLALERSGGNKSEAARALGLSRGHFYRLEKQNLGSGNRG